jgi:hypothetical protein
MIAVTGFSFNELNAATLGGWCAIEGVANVENFWLSPSGRTLSAQPKGAHT